MEIKKFQTNPRLTSFVLEKRFERHHTETPLESSIFPRTQLLQLILTITGNFYNFGQSQDEGEYALQRNGESGIDTWNAQTMLSCSFA
jgi:hypothetical protein